MERLPYAPCTDRRCHVCRRRILDDCGSHQSRCNRGTVQPLMRMRLWLCMCLSVHICVCGCGCACVCLYIYMRACVCVRACVCTYMCVRLWLCMCVPVHICVCGCGCACVCLYIYMCACVCVRVCVTFDTPSCTTVVHHAITTQTACQRASGPTLAYCGCKITSLASVCVTCLVHKI